MARHKRLPLDTVALVAPTGTRVTVSADLAVRFTARGFVEAEPRDVRPGPTPEPEEESADPESGPSEEWTNAQLDDYGKALGIPMSGARSKAAKLAAIASATDPEYVEVGDVDDEGGPTPSTTTDW